LKKLDKPRIGIFDLTDCEGCELEVINLREKLLDLLEGVEIVSWRLAQGKDAGSFDISFVEGTPITPDERDFLKYIRENSEVLVGLGACACLGGIPAIIDDESDRGRFYREIYPSGYEPKGTESKSISAYVKVDYFLDGCPVDTGEIKRVLSEYMAGKTPKTLDYPVCMECKIADNRCLLANGEPCLGPITKGGCGAFCVSHGKKCYGCYGLVEDANFDRMVKRLNEIQSRKETMNLLGMFLSETDEYRKAFKWHSMEVRE